MEGDLKETETCSSHAGKLRKQPRSAEIWNNGHSHNALSASGRGQDHTEVYPQCSVMLTKYDPLHPFCPCIATPPLFFIVVHSIFVISESPVAWLKLPACLIKFFPTYHWHYRTFHWDFVMLCSSCKCSSVCSVSRFNGYWCPAHWSWWKQSALRGRSLENANRCPEIAFSFSEDVRTTYFAK